MKKAQPVLTDQRKTDRENDAMISTQYVTDADKAFWFTLDTHLSEQEFYKKVRDRQGYVLFADGVPKGVLRYGLFWDNTPFCNMLYVEPSAQKQGYGRMLMEFWEADMRSQGYGMTLTSTRTDEDAQHFYRKLGYRDCGGLTIDIPAFAQPMELFLSKAL